MYLILHTVCMHLCTVSYLLHQLHHTCHYILQQNNIIMSLSYENMWLTMSLSKFTVLCITLLTYTSLHEGLKYFFILCKPCIRIPFNGSSPKICLLLVTRFLEDLQCWLTTRASIDPLKLGHHLHLIISHESSMYNGCPSSSVFSSLAHFDNTFTKSGSSS